MIHDQKLHVAPPKGRNLQLSDSAYATSDKGNATGHATIDLKALANRYLERKECNRPCNHHATDQQKPMQLSGAFERPKVAYSEERTDWLEWIASEVPLVPEDRVYVWARLMTLPPGGVEAVARRYVQRWQEAADAEPKPHRKDNAGRRAANRGLLYLVEPGGSGATRVWLGWMKGGRGDDLQRRRH